MAASTGNDLLIAVLQILRAAIDWIKQGNKLEEKGIHGYKTSNAVP